MAFRDRHSGDQGAGARDTRVGAEDCDDVFFVIGAKINGEGTRPRVEQRNSIGSESDNGDAKRFELLYGGAGVEDCFRA
jgi:hypothetical protein